jgi:predicted secreted protein
MIRSTAKAALLALGLAATAQPAMAGDLAELQILGFSEDASIFAFEEYGVQDGSGFPYARRFYIDVAADAFVSGTPIRVLLQDETASLAEARAQARAPGQGIVSDAELAANRGHTAGSNAVTELSADPWRMAVNPRPVVPPIDEAIEFRLEEYPMDRAGCEDLGPTMGFRLLRIDLVPRGSVSLLHQDDRIPQSRGCPLGYRIGAVQTIHPRAGGAPSFAVLIAVRSFGFEGPDHRWIAVTGRL